MFGCQMHYVAKSSCQFSLLFYFLQQGVHRYILHVDYAFLLVVINNIWEMLKKKGDPYISLEILDWEFGLICV